MTYENAYEHLQFAKWKDILSELGAEYDEFLGVYMVVCPFSGEEDHYIECRGDHTFVCELCCESGVGMLDFILMYLGFDPNDLDDWEEAEEKITSIIKKTVCQHDPRQGVLFHPATVGYITL